MKVIILGNFPIARENSSYQLVREVGKLCQDLGVPTKIIGNQPNCCSTTECDDVDVHVLPLYNSSKDWWKFKIAIRQLTQLVTKETVFIIYSSPTFSPFLFLLGIKFWHNLKIGYHVDRSSVSHGSRVTRLPRIINRALIVFFYLCFCHKMLVVSTPYIKYYRNRKFRGDIFVMPPLKKSEFVSRPKPVKPDKPLELVYVGTPFPLKKGLVKPTALKDRLDVAIDFVKYMRVQGVEVSIDIFGLTESEYKNVVTRHIEEIDNCDAIRFHGRVCLDEVRKKVALSDFSVVIRDKSIMSDFGFSSKLVESIALGTRVITTRTSDIENYLNCGQVVYLESYTNDGFDALYEEIKGVCETTCWTNPFDPMNFLNEFNKFLTG